MLREIGACQRPARAEEESELIDARKGGEDGGRLRRSPASLLETQRSRPVQPKPPLAQAAGFHGRDLPRDIVRRAFCWRKSASGCSGTRSTGFTPAAGGRLRADRGGKEVVARNQVTRSRAASFAPEFRTNAQGYRARPGPSAAIALSHRVCRRLVHRRDAGRIRIDFLRPSRDLLDSA